MGLFLAMSGIAGADIESVKHALKTFAENNQGRIDPSPATAETWEFMIISESQPGRVTVLYPGSFMRWDEAASHISNSLGLPVFSFHIHDDDLWMYLLFNRGDEVDRFNPISEYWGELSDDERASWTGSASAVAENWPDVDASVVEKYLIEWNLDDDAPPKAHPDDQFGCDSWQLTDFMRRLGLEYPIDDRGQAHGESFKFDVEDE